MSIVLLSMAFYRILHLLILVSVIHALDSTHENNFLECMLKHPSTKDNNISKYVHFSNSSSYLNLLHSAQHNPRWMNSTSSRPEFLVTPYNHHQIRATILCSKKKGLQMRARSGGHDYEGLSYRSKTPFVLVDLFNLRSIKIKLKEETAWVQTGATIGELYYNIAKKSNVHGFPAGLYPSVGVGGHFSAGGIGTLTRKYGLAADNIIDARFMDSEGKIFDRKSMGEDLFWAIRGGGGASFGIILAWKVKLVRVPPIVTVFSIRKNLDNEAIEVVDKWQHIAAVLPQDLLIRVLLFNIPGNGNHEQTNATAIADFNSIFLGNLKDLLSLMDMKFPELGLKEKDCTEMSWINSTLYFSVNTNKPLEVLLDRSVKPSEHSFKGKSDFLDKPLPKSVYGEINKRLVREGTSFVIIDPFGGKMDMIGESELPFPHRKGNLFSIQYLFKWNANDTAKKHLDWISEIYEFMEPYVSSSPRTAYLNYKDLDIGFNKKENSSYEEAAIWGRKYFKGNFKRLAKVKKVVDPNNYFRNEQSIPPIS